MSAITVNGEPRAERPENVRALVEREGLDPERRGLAVARNGRVVPRQQWAETSLADGDAIEIVKPFAGG
jgi:sulfur carrier protein